MRPLSPDPRSWKTRTAQPLQSLSIFDSLLSIHNSSKTTHITNDPRRATRLCRHLVHCKWQAFLSSLTRKYHHQLDNFLFKKPLDQTSTWFHTWDISWSPEASRRLTFTMLAAEQVVGKDIDSNLKALGIGIGYSNCFLDADEAEEWVSLQKSGAALVSKFAVLIDSYLQEATMQESRTSNYQAHSLGRLTYVATALVPVSIVTGIFSMGGEFLVGERKFWVFWTVAIPVVIIITIVLFTSAVEFLWRHCRDLYSRCSLWSSGGVFQLPWKEESLVC